MAKGQSDSVELPTNEDLPEAWKRVVEACQQKARWKGDITSAQTSIDDIILKIKSSKFDSTKISHSADVFNRALRCIRIFGGIVAEGASVMFAPSRQIFNAVNYLVGFMQAYQEVFETLTTLMERAAVFLERLNRYWMQETNVKLAASLRPRVYTVLVDFVSIVAESYRLSDGWKGRGRKFKLVLFGETDEVRKLLEDFEVHVTDVTHETVSEIHVELGKAARSLFDVQEELQQFHQEQSAANKSLQAAAHQSSTSLGQVKSHLDDSEDSKLIVKNLGVDEQDPAWRAHGELFTDPVDASDTWFPEVFREWEDVRTTSQAMHSILGVVGPENHGKSYLCHEIVNRLGRLSIKRSVAWYYVQKEKRTSINKAVKHIIWQFAQADKSFFDYIKPKIKDLKPGEAENTIKIWRDLVMGFAKKQPHTVFFVVLDGIDQLETETEDSLSQIVRDVRTTPSQPEGLRVRLMVSGRRNSFQNLEANWTAWTEPLRKMNLSPTPVPGAVFFPQDTAVRKLIERRLNEIFSGKVNDEDIKIRQKIKDSLPEIAHGNFDTVKRLLDEIERCTFSSGMEKVLQGAGRNSKERITDDINNLNEQLDGDEIQQLNLILSWLATAKVSTDLDSGILRSVLSLHPSLKRGVLRNPGEFIKKKCSTLISTDSDMITLSNDVQAILEASKSVRDTIPASEVKLVQSILRVHFERTFGDGKIYKDFEFEEFFNSKAAPKSALVHLPEQTERNLYTLELCLKTICDLHDSEQHAKLREYASEYFDEHLVDSNLALAKPDVKQRLGPRLWRLLRDDDVLRVWVNEDRLWTMTDWFAIENKVCASIVSWMTDDEIQTSLQSVTTERDWLKDVSDGKVPAIKALEHVCRHILRRFFGSTENMGWAQLLWLRLYHQKMTAFPVHVEDNGYIGEGPSIQELQSLEDWSKSQLPTQKPARWHSRMANIYLMANESFHDPSNELLTIALARCDQAIEADRFEQTEWNAHMMKAKALLLFKKHQTCLETLLKLTEQKQDILDEIDGDDVFSSAATMLGDCYVELEQLENAEIWYQRVVNRAIEKAVYHADFATQASKLFGVLLMQKKHTTVLALLQTLDKRFDSADGRKSWLMRILGEPCDIHKHIIELAQQPEQFGLLSDYYTRASESINLKQSPEFAPNFNRIRFNQWRLHWYRGPPRQQDSALDGWQSLLNTDSDNKYAHWPTWVGSVKELTQALFRRAMENGPDVEPTETHIARLEDVRVKAASLEELPGYNVKFAQARLHHVAGNTEEARKLLRWHVRKAIMSIEEKDGFLQGCNMLAHIFPLIDDDINAKAAWQLMEPRRADDPTKGHSESVENGEDQQTRTNNSSAFDSGPSASSHDKQDITAADGSTIGHTHPPEFEAVQASPGAERDEIAPNLADPLVTTAVAQESPIVSPPMIKPDLDGDVHFECDGRCGRVWTYASDMYVCKDCLDLQLDRKCYEKLQNGTLDITVCSKSHKHLYVPPFDVEVWKLRDPDMLVVGERVISRTEWLEGLKSDWGNIHWTTRRAVSKFQQRWILRKKEREEQGTAKIE
ncbi:hypothetical protein Q7P37_008432 [Cladosporium fusiforme]